MFVVRVRFEIDFILHAFLLGFVSGLRVESHKMDVGSPSCFSSCTGGSGEARGPCDTTKEETMSGEKSGGEADGVQ